MPLFSIAVRTCTRARYPEELLPQFVTQIEYELRSLAELPLIANASTDGTQDLIDSKFAGSLRYLHNRENIGGDCNFCECNNGHLGTSHQSTEGIDLPRAIPELAALPPANQFSATFGDGCHLLREHQIDLDAVLYQIQTFCQA